MTTSPGKHIGVVICKYLKQHQNIATGLLVICTSYRVSTLRGINRSTSYYTSAQSMDGIDPIGLFTGSDWVGRVISGKMSSGN